MSEWEDWSSLGCRPSWDVQRLFDVFLNIDSVKKTIIVNKISVLLHQNNSLIVWKSRLNVVYKLYILLNQINTDNISKTQCCT